MKAHKIAKANIRYFKLRDLYSFFRMSFLFFKSSISFFKSSFSSINCRICSSFVSSYISVFNGFLTSRLVKIIYLSIVLFFLNILLIPISVIRHVGIIVIKACINPIESFGSFILIIFYPFFFLKGYYTQIKKSLWKESYTNCHVYFDLIKKIELIGFDLDNCKIEFRKL